MAMNVYGELFDKLATVRARAVFAVALGALVAGCTFSDERASCPPWSRAADAGGCRERDWTLLETNLGQVATDPAVALDRDGRAWLAWQEGYHGASAVVVARERGDDWTLASPSAGAEGYFHYHPRLAVAGDGSLLVAWEGSRGEGETRARVVLGAGTWIVPPGGEVFSLPVYGREHDVAAADDGELLLVWNQGLNDGNQRGISIARRAPGASDFERPAAPWDVLSNTVFFSNTPRVVRNRRGDALVTWFESLGGKLHTYASERWGVDGAFSHPGKDAALSPPHGDVENPEPAIAEDGSAAVVWRQVRLDGSHAVFLALRDASGTWTTPATLDDWFSQPADFVWNTRVAFAEQGDLYVAWEQKRGDDWAVMLAHRDAEGRWSAPGSAPLRLSGPGRQAIAPRLAVGPRGGVAAVWREKVDGVWRLMVRLGSARAEGAREEERWSEAVPLSPAELGDASGGAVAIDGPEERVVVAWSQLAKIALATFE